ncbi:uncharacterized protein LODBEIA_P29940 [Lodderomyces beijingensis]|uniref:Uncharacterized protein n=1 Tax=Lodderomyces beijingensis TaxID=1775926 RepID=A0ABP0ZKU6_9ASCO
MRSSVFSGRSPVVTSSPRFDQSQQSSFNPYEAARERQEMFQKTPASPRIVIDNDPIVPEYAEVNVHNSKKCNYSMKIVVVGDGAVGKSCLLISYSSNQFPEIYVPTIFENYVRTVMSPSGKTIELALWDTAGQEEYDRLRPLSYPDVDLLLICFALDNVTSLSNVKELWFPEVNHYCPGIPIILVGTKSDLPSDIPEEIPLKIATDIGAIAYLKCSAKTMHNIRTVFNYALNHFQKKMELQEQIEKSNNGGMKRISKRFGSSGNHDHLRTSSNTSNTRRGHLKNTSYDSTLLLDQPLTEDLYEKNPYGNFGRNSGEIYKNTELDFIKEKEKREKKKKSKRCVIL